MTKIAIIGTAGRDKTKPMTRALWDWMFSHALGVVHKDSHVVSGGAAWADHLAVALFLHGHAKDITLYLPAPFNENNNQFIGLSQSSASAANYYHWLFSTAINHDTLQDIKDCINSERCHGECEREARGYGGMFARNLKVATADQMLAYTFGMGAEPADGGTLSTWAKHMDLHPQGQRTHVTLPILR